MSRKARPREVRQPDALSAYLDEIARYRLLTAHEEAALARRARAGDEEAFDALVRANLRFVVSMAKRYQWRGVPLADLVSEGNLGLVRAARRFDETRGTRFVTYAAWYIQQAIAQALADQGGVLRIPLDHTATLRRLGTQCRALAQALGREPTRAEVAAALGVSEEEVTKLLAVSRGAVSLDAPRRAGRSASPLDTLADPGAPDPGEPVMRDALARVLAQSLVTLGGREVHVLRAYFGLDGVEPRSLLEIGRTLGVTRERARQIKAEALARLRHRRATGPRLAAHR